MMPLNLFQWIEENRHLLKPPVGNKLVWENTDFMVTIVGGPNARKDFHVNPTEEFFYQIEGDMVLRIIDENKKIKDIPIKQGEIFLLPPNVPHSPQRKENTVGMVIERIRQSNDALEWYCENCHQLLYHEEFYLTNLTTQLQPVLKKFYESIELRTCKNCGTVFEPPAHFLKKS